VTTAIVDSIATIAIHRVEVANAIDRQANDALAAALKEADRHGDVHAIIITGAGRYFCAGADLRDARAASDTRSALLSFGGGLTGTDGDRWRPAKPLIAMVNGAAVGGGAELALACDFVVLAESGFLQFPEAQRGFVANATVGHWLMRQMPPRIASEIVLSGRRVPAAECLRWGIVNRVVPDEQLQVETTRFATEVLGLHPEAVRVSLAALREGAELPLSEALHRRYSEVERYRRSPEFAAVLAGFEGRDHA
jgi:enoyl-CoA hydratase/carnithine racemase